MNYLKQTKSPDVAFYQGVDLGGRSFFATYWNQGSLGKEVTKRK